MIDFVAACFTPGAIVTALLSLVAVLLLLDLLADVIAHRQDRHP